MESIALRCGRGEVRLRIPAASLQGFIRPGSGRSPAGGGRLLEDAAARPEFSGPLAGRRVALLASDATREEPRPSWVRAMAPALRRAKAVRLVIATGSHAPRTPSQRATAALLEELLIQNGVDTGEPFVHDAFGDDMADLGATRRGTPVRLSREPMQAEAFVIASEMKPHYFAGYSAPPKFLFPGLAALPSIEANHALTLAPGSAAGRHPWHPDPSRRDNPLAEDLCEAAGMALAGRPAVALAFGSSGGKILWAEGGPLREATARGMARVDELNGARARPATHLVISAGGYPADIDLYVGQRALELCHEVMAPGARVLFLCACEEGLGPDHSLPAFIAPLRGDLQAAAAGPAGPYRLYSHKAIRFARMILALQALHLHSEIPAASLKGLPFQEAPDPQAIVDGWLGDDPRARILFIDGASKLSVTAAGDDAAMIP